MNTLNRLYKEKKQFIYLIFGNLAIIFLVAIRHYDDKANLITGLTFLGIILIIFCIGLRNTLKAIRSYRKYLERLEHKMIQEEILKRE
ncbi:hypothetical protein DMB95_09375 [Campylobacter sp. MIT 12-8780]|nr:hypothetical protein CQA38_08425 [Campylobacter sp. MIT 12-5580]TQR39989.1 hypothetical protein DMB95_09375 [Campylobacter sp. MIT 12-8780]